MLVHRWREVQPALGDARSIGDLAQLGLLRVRVGHRDQGEMDILGQLAQAVDQQVEVAGPAEHAGVDEELDVSGQAEGLADGAGADERVLHRVVQRHERAAGQVEPGLEVVGEGFGDGEHAVGVDDAAGLGVDEGLVLGAGAALDDRQAGPVLAGVVDHPHVGAEAAHGQACGVEDVGVVDVQHVRLEADQKFDERRIVGVDDGLGPLRRGRHEGAHPGRGVALELADQAVRQRLGLRRRRGSTLERHADDPHVVHDGLAGRGARRLH